MPATLASLSGNRQDAAGLVVQVDLEGEDALRIKSLGICIGRRVEVVRSGDPLIVRVAGARIGISRRLAWGVWVEPADTSQAGGAEGAGANRAP